MRNVEIPRIQKLISLAKKLPYFGFSNLATIEFNKTYLKIFLSRYEKKNKLIRLKRALYVTKEYIDEIQKNNTFSSYVEFIANILYQPSYLSLDYILYKHNILTEVPKNFTSVTKKKTISFSNKLGNFFYHKIKDNLFYGFEIAKEGDYTVLRATKAKALFDFLYLRKNNLANRESVKELRLNIENFIDKEKKEIKKYIKIEGSEKMKQIFNYLFE